MIVANEQISAFEAFLIEQERSAATVEKYVRDVRAFGAFWVMFLTNLPFGRIIGYVIKYFHHIMRIMW